MQSSLLDRFLCTFKQSTQPVTHSLVHSFTALWYYVLAAVIVVVVEFAQNDYILLFLVTLMKLLLGAIPHYRCVGVLIEICVLVLHAWLICGCALAASSLNSIPVTGAYRRENFTLYSFPHPS